MSWYWWLCILIYLMGVSFTAGASIHESAIDSLQKVLLVILWPIAVAGVFYHNRIHDNVKDWIKFDFIKAWYVNRKEDKLFYEKCLDDKFERLGLKFDENDDIWRS